MHRNRPARIAAVSILSLVLSLTSAAALAAVSVPSGFTVEEIAGGPDLSYITSLAFDGDGVLYAGEANVITRTGRVLRLEDRDGDGTPDTIIEHASGLGQVTGITFRGEGFPIRPPKCAGGAVSAPTRAAVYTDLERIRQGQFVGRPLELFVSHFTPGTGGSGSVSVLRDLDRDGVADDREDIVIGLPSDGENGNQQIAVGPDGRLYFAQGGRTNSGVPAAGRPADTLQNGTILAVESDGTGLEVHASGLRNAFDLLFTPCGELLATENGPDDGGPNPIADAPDELNAIVAGGDYGWPDHFGFPPRDTGTLGPIAEFEPTTSTNGIALTTPRSWCGFSGDLFAAQFGSFSDTSIGRRLVRLRLIGQRGVLVDEFATGFDRPLDVAFGPDGALYVADFSDPFFSPRSAAIYRIAPADADDDGTPDICQ